MHIGRKLAILAAVIAVVFAYASAAFCYSFERSQATNGSQISWSVELPNKSPTIIVISTKAGEEVRLDYDRDGSPDKIAYTNWRTEVEKSWSVSGIFHKLRIVEKNKKSFVEAIYHLNESRNLFELVSIFEGPHQVHYDSASRNPEEPCSKNGSASDFEDLMKDAPKVEAAAIEKDPETRKQIDKACDETKVAAALAELFRSESSGRKARMSCLKSYPSLAKLADEIRADYERRKLSADGKPLINCTATVQGGKKAFFSTDGSITLNSSWYKTAEKSNLADALFHELVHSRDLNEERVKQVETCCSLGAKPDCDVAKASEKVEPDPKVLKVPGAVRPLKKLDADPMNSHARKSFEEKLGSSISASESNINRECQDGTAETCRKSVVAGLDQIKKALEQSCPRVAGASCSEAASDFSSQREKVESACLGSNDVSICPLSAEVQETIRQKLNRSRARATLKSTVTDSSLGGNRDEELKTPEQRRADTRILDGSPEEVAAKSERTVGATLREASSKIAEKAIPVSVAHASEAPPRAPEVANSGTLRHSQPLKATKEAPEPKSTTQLKAAPLPPRREVAIEPKAVKTAKASPTGSIEKSTKSKERKILQQPSTTAANNVTYNITSNNTRPAESDTRDRRDSDKRERRERDTDASGSGGNVGRLSAISGRAGSASNGRQQTEESVSRPHTIVKIKATESSMPEFEAGESNGLGTSGPVVGKVNEGALGYRNQALERPRGETQTSPQAQLAARNVAGGGGTSGSYTNGPSGGGGGGGFSGGSSGGGAESSRSTSPSQSSAPTIRKTPVQRELDEALDTVGVADVSLLSEPQLLKVLKIVSKRVSDPRAVLKLAPIEDRLRDLGISFDCNKRRIAGESGTKARTLPELCQGVGR